MSGAAPPFSGNAPDGEGAPGDQPRARPSVTISVIIATQRRAAPLRVAARSVMRQTGVDPAELELVIVDNDAQPSAQPIVAGLAAEAPFPVRYVHEPQPGVASARNAAVAVARGSSIAFLDDDQEASPGWLAALIATRDRLGADAVFGPVRGALPPRVRRHRRYLERFFSHPGPAIETRTTRGYGAGVCLLRRTSLPDPDRPFESHWDLIGGEDDALFAQMLARGAVLAWNPHAWVWEHPAETRLDLGYAMRRTFVYGQGGTTKHLIREPPDRLAAVGSRLVGVAQAGVFATLGVVLWLIRFRDRAFVYDKAMRGLGKTFAGPRYRLKFYGLDPGEAAGRRLRSPRARR